MMPTFTVFDAETGEVLRSGFCAPQDVHLQSSASSEIVIEGQYQDDRFKITFTEHGLEPVPVIPSDGS
jgi:hypothetical protein